MNHLRAGAGCGGRLSAVQWRRSRIGRQLGCEELGASLFEVASGGATFPLHAHHANEELIIVISGSLVLRPPEGERELHPGALAACPRGLRGPHRLDNTIRPARVLIVSTMNAPGINEFPDSQLLWARTYAPGSDPPNDAAETASRPSDFDPLALP
jgi:uncharacterized cupin superfamily protein